MMVENDEAKMKELKRVLLEIERWKKKEKEKGLAEKVS
jgi:hypothetical protein